MLLLFVEVVSGPDLGSLYNLLNKIKQWQWVWKTLTWHPLKICSPLSLSSIYFLKYILQVCLKILKLQLTVYFCKYGIFCQNVLIFLDNSSLNRLWNGWFNLLLPVTSFFYVAVCKVTPACISLHTPRYDSKSTFYLLHIPSPTHPPVAHF